MLRRMLMIGVGGSGGKTLRFTREELQRRLLERGWNGPLPECWQFIQVDAPTTADGNEPGLPATLPGNDYVGVASYTSPYHFYDERMVPDVASAEAVAGWRPNPFVDQPEPTKGAGQFRAIGRVIYAAGVGSVAQRIERAVATLSQADEDHRLVNEALGASFDTAIAEPPPAVFVISSLAGGSGAGMFLDIADLLRWLAGRPETAWLRESMGILYAPDVFDELDEFASLGVQPNALASVAELMAASWDTSGVDGDEALLLGRSGIGGNVKGQTRRGLEYSFLVGRSNKGITLADQVAVYRAMGTLLAVIASKEEVQDQLVAYPGANRGNTMHFGGEAPFLPSGSYKPFYGMGYASLGLGRDLFGQYASQRLARSAVDHLLRAHWVEGVPKKITPEAARDKVVAENYEFFVGACGLSERSTTNNQVLDAVRNADAVKARLGELKDLIGRKVRGLPAMAPAEWSRVIEGQVGAEHDEFIASQTSAMQTAGTTWVEDIQERTVATVSRYVAQFGLPVTTELVRRLNESELGEVVGELQNEALDHERKMSNARGGASRVLGEWAAAQMTPENELLPKAVKETLNTLWFESEAAAARLTADVIADLREGFLRPLYEALTRALSGLEVELDPPSSHPSPYARWPVRGVPADLTPAPNEFILEPVDTWPDSYEQAVASTVGTATYEAARLTKIEEVVTGVWSGRTLGDEPVTAQTAIEIRNPWRPTVPELRSGATPPSTAKFACHYSLEALHDRAREWVYQGERAMGEFVRETLEEYLDPGNSVPERVAAGRRQQFANQLRKALEAAEPLVSVNQNLVARLYEGVPLEAKPIMTPMPFPAGHPARDEVEAVLTKSGVSEQNLPSCFGSQPISQVEITRLLPAPVDPVVFDSFAGPIEAEWRQRQTDQSVRGFWALRRTRPLDRFVPVPPTVRDAMIRGWLTARLLNMTSEFDRDDPEAVWVLGADGTKLRFPEPMLGPPPGSPLEVLPALLETLPVAMLDFAVHRTESSQAYNRLVELGRPRSHDLEASYEHPNRELEAWVVDGAVAPGLPDPDPAKAGQPGSPGDEAAQTQRQQAIVATLETYSRQVAKARAAVSVGTRYQPVDRSWEVAHLVIKACDDLRRAVGNIEIEVMRL